MSKLLSFARDPFVMAYAVIYVVTLGVLRVVEGFGLALPIIVLLTMGIAFTSVAVWATRGITPDRIPVRNPLFESGVFIAYLLVIAGSFLGYGLNYFVLITSEPLHTIAILAAKLSIFVAGPYLLFRVIWGYRIKDLADLRFPGRALLPVILWMLLIVFPFQMLLGQGVSEIRESGFAVWQLLVGAPFAFAWLIVEVGLVEEFSFRVLLQSRLAALLRSEVGGVIVMALLFGLTHAPGLYLRTGNSIEALGPSPSLLMAVGYSIVVISPAGFFLGALWARTRNLWLVMIVHAAFDWIPGLSALTKSFFPG